MTALVVVQVFFSLHYLAAKVLLDTIPPRSWALLRAGSGALILLAAAAALRRPFPRRPGDLAKLALFALFGIVVNQVCFVEGLHRTTPSHSAILMTSVPAATLLFAILLGRERRTRRKLVAVALAFVGVMLVLRPEQASFSSQTFVGDSLQLINALSFSFFLVISKRLLERLDTLAATAVLMSFGAIGIVPVAWVPLGAFRPGEVPAHVWWLAAFIVVFPTAGAYFLNYWALRRADPSIVALFIYLQPVLATGLSVWLLGERPESRTILGGIFVCAGVWLGARRTDGR